MTEVTRFEFPDGSGGKILWNEDSQTLCVYGGPARWSTPKSTSPSWWTMPRVATGLLTTTPTAF